MTSEECIDHSQRFGESGARALCTPLSWWELHGAVKERMQKFLGQGGRSTLPALSSPTTVRQSCVFSQTPLNQRNEFGTI